MNLILYRIILYKGDHSHGIAMTWSTTRYGTRSDQYWSEICGTGFTNVEATVFCRELGFQNGRTLPFGSYGRHYGTYYGNNITCTGTEMSIRNCSTTPGRCNTRSGNGYASVHCYNGTISTNMSVALNGGVQQYADITGRVYVTRMGIRGKISDAFWDDKDASVVCRQLGMRGGVSYQYSSTEGLGPYLPFDVDCFGNETSLLDCDFESETRSPRNNYRQDAGVLCYRNQPIRIELVGGNYMKGRVEIIYEGMRGTICSSNPSSTKARILCKQLGYNDGIVSRNFGRGGDLVYMSNPICYGTETSIFQCSNAGWRTGISSRCQDHTFDLGVVCYENVRVTRGFTNANVSLGIVQFYRSNSWETVCGTGFDSNDASVVCLELGYPYGVKLHEGSFRYHYFSRTTAINYMNCNGNETSVTQCGFIIGGCSTNRNNYASVLCTKTAISNEFQFNVTLGTTFPSMVIVSNFGTMVAFCNEGFTDREARVVCRSKGYRSGVAFGSVYTFHSLNAFGVTCRGNETDLNDCAITTDISPCGTSANKSANVYCFNDDTGLKIRLARTEGRIDNGGRVEVHIGGQWGTVCDSNFGNTDAGVVCRQLGYLDGFARTSNYYGGGTGHVWFENPYCNGSEAALWNCPFSFFNSTSSYSSCGRHRHDAAVHCIGKCVPPSKTTPVYGGPNQSTQMIFTSQGMPATAVAVPIVCVLFIAVAVGGFLFYKRRYHNKSAGLVPITLASSGGGTGASFTSSGVIFSKSANAGFVDEEGQD